MKAAPFILTCDDKVWPDFIGMEKALQALQKGAILDALEERICAVEDAGLNSVGVSGIPDKQGNHTLDAGIMTGWNRLSASIGSLEGYQNPFRVTRLMWELQKQGFFPHNFLVDQGAALFAKQHNAKASTTHSPHTNNTNAAHDTVGCIARHEDQWAVGTSTSGWGGKEVGRLGDCPVPGGGFYANEKGAAFCTWTGEVATRLSLASRAMIALEMGHSLEQAVAFAFSALKGTSDGHIDSVILHVATNEKAAVVGVGFEHDIVPATYSYWRQGMIVPKRCMVPSWKEGLPVPVF